MAASDDKPERGAEILNAFSDRRADGLILATVPETDRDLLKGRLALPVPTVLLDRDTVQDHDAILIAHREGMLRAMKYLLDMGHKRIALVTATQTCVLRGSAFRDTRRPTKTRGCQSTRR